MNCLKDFFARLFYNPNKAADKNYEYLVKQDKKLLWVKEHGYKIQVSLDLFADIFNVIKDMPQEDIRKFSLSVYWGFDIYSIITRGSFVDTIKANENWLEFSDKIDRWEKGPAEIVKHSTYYLKYERLIQKIMGLNPFWVEADGQFI